MSEETNGAVVTSPEEGGQGTEPEVVSIKKEEYDSLNQTLGSLKRELKDLKKAKEDTKDTTKEEKPEEFGLLHKSYLRAAGITAEDEVELARSIQKKTGIDWDKLVDDDYFTTKLESLRTTKANEQATSGVKGSAGGSEAKNTPEYWIAKGTPPTPDQVPDRKTRAKIARAMMEGAKSGKQFYNS